MAEYIDRDLVTAALKKHGIIPNMRAHTAILSIPAADVVEVRQGRWVNTHSDSEFVQCCLCQYPVYAAWNETNYCPNCGARMDKEAGTDEMP